MAPEPFPLTDDELDRLIAEELRATVIHEATHAALHVFFGIPFDRVEVFTDEHPEPPDLKEYAGIVHSEWVHDLPCWATPGHPGFRADRAVRYWDQLTCIFLAGELGESAYTGHRAPKSVGKFDREGIRFLCRRVMGCSMSDVSDWIEEMRSLTLEMLSLPVMRAAVAAIAEHLLAQAVLTRGEVQVLVKRACTARRALRPKPLAKTMRRIHRLSSRLAGIQFPGPAPQLAARGRRGPVSGVQPRPQAR
jgi:hypothetical protein